MKRVILLMVVLLCGFSASAQRTVQKQFFIQAQESVLQGYTTRVGVGQYGIIGYWNLDAGVMLDKEVKGLMTAGLNSGYMWRLLATPSRVFNIYGGLGGSFAYRFPKDQLVLKPVEGSVDDRVDEQVSHYDNAILFGVYPKLEMEVFPFSGAALFISGSAPYIFRTEGLGDSKSKARLISGFALEASIGIRILL